MEKEDVRAFLIKHYEEKATFHLKNINSLAILFATVALSQSTQFIPSFLQVHFFTYILMFLCPFIYFYLRSKYWTARSWSTMVVKPESERDRKKTREDNYIHRFSRASLKEMADSPVSMLKSIPILKRVRYKHLDETYFRYLGLFYGPFGIYFGALISQYARAHHLSFVLFSVLLFLLSIVTLRALYLRFKTNRERRQ